jgi:hypothetical protein
LFETGGQSRPGIGGVLVTPSGQVVGTSAIDTRPSRGGSAKSRSSFGDEQQRQELISNIESEFFQQSRPELRGLSISELQSRRQQLQSQRSQLFSQFTRLGGSGRADNFTLGELQSRISNVRNQRTQTRNERIMAETSDTILTQQTLNPFARSTAGEIQRDFTNQALRESLEQRRGKLEGLPSEDLISLSLQDQGLVGQSTSEGFRVFITPTEQEISTARKSGRQSFFNLPEEIRISSLEREGAVVGLRGVGGGLDIISDFASGQSLQDVPSFSEQLPFIGEKIRKARSTPLSDLSPLRNIARSAGEFGISGIVGGALIPVPGIRSGQIESKIVSSQLVSLEAQEFRTASQTFRFSDDVVSGIEVGVRTGDLGGNQVFVSGGISSNGRGLSATKLTTEIDPFSFIDNVPLTRGFKNTEEGLNIVRIGELDSTPQVFTKLMTGQQRLGFQSLPGEISLSRSGAQGFLTDDALIRTQSFPGQDNIRNVISSDISGNIRSRGIDELIDLRNIQGSDKGFTSFERGSRPRRTGQETININDIFTPTSTSNSILRTPQISLISRSLDISLPTIVGGTGSRGIFTGTGLFERTDLLSPTISRNQNIVDTSFNLNKLDIVNFRTASFSDSRSLVNFGTGQVSISRLEQPSSQGQIISTDLRFDTLNSLDFSFPQDPVTPFTFTDIGPPSFRGRFGLGALFPPLGFENPFVNRAPSPKRRFIRTPSLEAVGLGIVGDVNQSLERTGLFTRPLTRENTRNEGFNLDFSNLI